MPTQFDRIYEVQIGTTIIKTADLRFKATRTLRAKPNTCSINIYNLSEPTRGAIAESKHTVVQIKAGYRGLPTRSEALAAVDEALGTGAQDGAQAGVIFRGDVREVSSTYMPPDWETYVEGGDGERQIRTARINKSYAKGTSVEVIMRDMAKAMKVNIGNAAKRALASGSLEGAGKEFLNGVTVSGSAYREMEAIVRSAGKELSVQNGNLQILDRGQALQDVSVILTPDTGLIGSPTVNDKGIVSIRALMNPAIVPGRQLELRSRSVTGRLRAIRCDYVGDTEGEDWYVDVEAKAL